MLVVVAVCNIHLTQAIAGIIAVHLRQKTDFQAPVTGNSKFAHHIRLQRKLAGQGIAKTVEIIEVVGIGIDFFQGSHQRGNQQAADPAVDTGVGNPRVIALAELIAEGRVRYRVKQSRGQQSLVGHDVAVVQGDCLAAP